MYLLWIFVLLFCQPHKKQSHKSNYLNKHQKMLTPIIPNNSPGSYVAIVAVIVKIEKNIVQTLLYMYMESQQYTFQPTYQLLLRMPPMNYR